MKKLLSLFLTMFKIGLFTFGGGYAMIALLENELVAKKGWIDREDFLNMVAIAESTPGPIAINAATYVGYRIAGFFGSLTATVAICIPSFAVIYAISLFFDAFLSLTLVTYAFKGIQVCVVYLILSAGLKMLKELKKDAFHLTLLIAVMACMILFALFAVRFSTVFYILICGTAGVFVYLLKLLRKGRDQKP